MPTTPSPITPLLADEVHVWHFAISALTDVLPGLFDTLCPDEQERAQRFIFERDRHCFIAARGSLRYLLAEYLDETPGEIRFCYNSYGKPAVDHADNEALQFNLSHSRDRVVLAFTRQRQLGVDVEALRGMETMADLAKRFFSPREAARLLALPPSIQPTAFFQCWTRKEAYIKARGKGLSIPLDQFEVSMQPGEPAALLATHDEPEQVERWSMTALDMGQEYLAALVVEGKHPFELVQRELELSRIP